MCLLSVCCCWVFFCFFFSPHTSVWYPTWKIRALAASWGSLSVAYKIIVQIHWAGKQIIQVAQSHCYFDSNYLSPNEVQWNLGVWYIVDVHANSWRRTQIWGAWIFIWHWNPVELLFVKYSAKPQILYILWDGFNGLSCLWAPCLVSMLGIFISLQPNGYIFW